MTDPTTLESALEHTFRDPNLLRRALTHSSTARNRTERVSTNERLEFLGDRVLGLVVARMLFLRFPDEEEGQLARRHAALVRREALARVAEGMGLGEYVVMARSEDDSGGRSNPATLANTCEAVIAALYLDGGLDCAETFITRFWAPLMDEDLSPPKDAKTALQEWAQGHGLPLPTYTQTARSGPDHAPTFTIEVAIEGHAPATASGPSKRAAEQTAAEVLLVQITVEEGV